MFAIEVANLNKTYDNGFVAVKELIFPVPDIWSPVVGLSFDHV